MRSKEERQRVGDGVAYLVYRTGPRMFNFTVLNVSHGIFELHVEWIGLIHGGNEKISAHVVNSFNRAYNARSASTEQFQKLFKKMD